MNGYFKLILKRNIFSPIMTIYIPTTLIVIVSYLTTFFSNRQWFGHIITINLTAMLVVTTMLTSITDYMPRTADIKVILGNNLIFVIQFFLNTKY